MTMVTNPPFDTLADRASRLLIDAGGGALCVYHHGAPVLDIWAGVRHPATGAPWAGDTTAMAWSTTKGVASTALHLLADRDQLDYDDLVASHWPEYAAAGKEATTIRHVLSMQAGLYDIRHLIDDPHLMLDHNAMAAALAAAGPAHPPGEASGYHALTYGWLVGELVRRISGVSLGKFVRTEIADPLGLDGFHIGTPTSELARVATRPGLKAPPAALRFGAKAVDAVVRHVGVSPARMAAAFVPHDGHLVMGTDEFLQAEVAGANGTFTARSLARFYATLASDDGLDGVRLWSPATRRAATQPQTTGRDLVLPLKMRWQLGFHGPFPRKHAAPGSFGFYGAYGSGALAFPERRLAIGLVVREALRSPLMTLLGPIVDCADRPPG